MVYRNRSLMYRSFGVLLLVVAVVATLPVQADERFPRASPQKVVTPSSVSLEAGKDNTLYEDVAGSLSNGAGDHFFVGMNGSGFIRRGVIAFDIAGNIPGGSTIHSVWLKLHMSRTITGSQPIELHRLLADWGEGSSVATGGGGGGGGGGVATSGDATWVHRFFDTDLWQTTGGDFSATVSASTSVENTGDYTWGPTAQMAADVEGWLDDPSSNFGWLLKGNESEIGTAKRFDSREISMGDRRPMLMVEFTPPPALQFSNVMYNVAEDQGSAVIAVTHSGATSGDVTVDYSTRDGTARAGSDYVATSGTLIFPNGGTADGIFTVPIVNEAFVEGDETVGLTLSKPTGGGVLGSPAAAVLVIGANDQDVDVNVDGFVDLLDLRLVVRHFWNSSSGGTRADVNRDGVVDIFDLALVARNLGRTAPRPLQPMMVQRAFPGLPLGELVNLTNLVQPDDGLDHVFITEQPGRIRVFPNDQAATEARVFLDITQRVSDAGNEEGLLGLAFDPSYRNNGYFYVYYSAAAPRRSVLSRFSVRPDSPEVADPGSEFVIIEIGQPFSNHNGGQIAFGPDGYLYVGLGDGGDAGDPFRNGQDRSTLLGSLLRIDVGGISGDKNYRVPVDNPFVGVAGARDEIWAYGLRNPWRFSFDDHSGTLIAADVGQSAWEEIDIVKEGLNYGWKVMEGAHCFFPSTGCDQTGLELPLWEYSRSAGNCAVTGGYVYRGRGTPWLLGAYVYGDYCSGRIWGLRSDGESVTEQMLLVDSDLLITSFGRDLSGNLYILSRRDGIYRLAP